MAIRFDSGTWAQYPLGAMGHNLSLTGHALVRQIGAPALVAAAGLLIGACGSSNSPSASSSGSHSPSPSSQATLISNVDACKLVTASDASTAAGATVTNFGGAGATATGACIYASSDGTASVIVFAQAYPDSTAAEAVSPEQIAASINNGAGVANAKAVSGIGDKAVEYSTTAAGGNGSVIFVFKSNVVLMIAITPSPSSNALEQLARTAVGRL
jgi:hypothetical protein